MEDPTTGSGSVAVGRFLVVDDEPNVRSSIRRILTAAGHTVRTLGSVAEALAALEGDDYDGVISDIDMPAMGGFELLRAMREKGYSTPLMFLTGGTDPELRTIAEREGAVGLIHKPFSAEDVRSTAKALLRVHD